LFRLQIGLEDRLQDQHRSHLHDTIFDARDTQSALPTHPHHLRDLPPSPIRIIPFEVSASRSFVFTEGTILT
jgi:hypothetical protein